MDDERERIAADLLAAERVIQWNAEHNAPHAEAAKRWAAELEREALRLTRAASPRAERPAAARRAQGPRR